MRICFAGTAGHWQDVAFSLPHPDWTVSGICPAWPGEDVGGLINALKTKGITSPVFEGYTQMLGAARPDAVVICGHNGQHGSMAIEAAARGIHILCEKPLCSSIAQLDVLEKTLAETNTKLMAMHTLRYDGVFAAARDFVINGGVGVIRLMDARKSYKMGTRHWHYAKRETYGGTLAWVGIHAIDWLRWFSGAEFTSVFARQSALHNNGNGEMETAAALCVPLVVEVSVGESWDEAH